MKSAKLWRDQVRKRARQTGRKKEGKQNKIGINREGETEKDREGRSFKSMAY
jgi:hypothetical protein